MQKVVQGIRDYNVSHELDPAVIHKIAFQCGSETLKGAESWYRFIKHHSGDRLYGFSVDNTGFLFGTFSKKHFRLSEIAVEKSNQSNGYGSVMLSLLFEECKKRGIYRITLRTPIQEKAYKWYAKFGGKIIGLSKDGKDYEMELNI
jgi:GNAT superfamily N-acetyltransferase